MLAPPPSFTGTASLNDASLRCIRQECLGIKGSMQPHGGKPTTECLCVSLCELCVAKECRKPEH